MLNIRLANTPLFCSDDINEIVEALRCRIPSIMSETGNGILSANQLGTAFLETIEYKLQGAVEDMQEMRE